MASDIKFVEYVAEQMDNAGSIRYRQMFGEYCVYCNDKVIGLICNNKLFVKQTEAGRAFIGKVLEAPAYEGAKLSFLIEDKLEDGDWLSELIKVTEQELPKPKPKKKSKKKNQL